MRKKLVFLISVTLLSCAFAQHRDTLPRPDYRHGKNLPTYDKSLFPAGTVKTPTGTWTELNPKIPRVDYMGIYFTGKDTGWSVGAFGAVIYTTNSGGNWGWAQAPTPAHLLAVHTYNGKTIVACGSWGAIVRSTNAGRTWENIISGVTGNLWSVQMLDDTLGWICGVGPALLKTTNAGLNWEQVQTGFNNFEYWS
ncbi:MAG: hypothetical protein HY965_01690, partial [Ignavibacteriales bacterium]|nr:hypothetical protein [Ignavibacteriales bacterium]